MPDTDLTPLRIYAINRAAPALRHLKDAFAFGEFPAQIGLDIAGEATDEELQSQDWDAAFIRWLMPELHEICLIERSLVGDEEEADHAISEGLRIASITDDTAGEMIVTDHIRRTRTVYECQLLPALLMDDDHPGWNALDTILRTIAAETDGLIYVEMEGFCDADGELILAESDEITSSMEHKQA